MPVSQFNIQSLDHAGRTTSVWSAEAYDASPRFGSVAMALLPASLILATATALLLALI
jgi:hypothetical protein